MSVGVDVTNTGKRSGSEVAQVYVAFPTATGEPPHQLKGFQKVNLGPGVTQHVTITLNARSFATWNTASNNWTTLAGGYGVLVGGSSRNLPLQATATIAAK